MKIAQNIAILIFLISPSLRIFLQKFQTYVRIQATFDASYGMRPFFCVICEALYYMELDFFLSIKGQMALVRGSSVSLLIVLLLAFLWKLFWIRFQIVCLMIWLNFCLVKYIWISGVFQQLMMKFSIKLTYNHSNYWIFLSWKII